MTFGGILGSGNGILVANPGSLACPSAVDGSSSTCSFTLVNTGTATITTLVIGNPTGTNAADFSQSNNCSSTLTSGAFCTVTVTFSPAIVGTETGSIAITSNLPTKNVSLSGVGRSTTVPGILVSPASLSFTGVPSGTTSASQTVTYTNQSGTTTSVVSTVVLAGANAVDFAQTNTCIGNVAPGASCTFTVTFSPSLAPGQTETASLQINDNSTSGQEVVSLSGTISSNPSPNTNLQPVNSFQWYQFITNSAVLQSVVLNPTTTATTQSSNNTAACTTQSDCFAPFAGMSNLSDVGAQTTLPNPAPGNVSTVDIHKLLPSGTKVVVHSTDWFVQGTNGDHIQTKYNSNDVNVVAAQDSDMIQRHMDGRWIDWYSQFNSTVDGATQKIATDTSSRCSSPQNCPLEFAIVEDQGAVTRQQGTRSACTGSSAAMQACILQDLCYANANYFGLPSYLKMNASSHAWQVGTNPLVSFFPPSDTTLWNPAVGNLKTLTASNGWAATNCPTGQQQANGGLLFVDIDTTNVAQSQYSGGSSWVGTSAWSTTSQFCIDGSSGCVAGAGGNYHESLYQSCNSNPSSICVGSAKKGFNDFPGPPFASWGTNRVVAQECGQTFLVTLGKALSTFTGTNLTVQLPTWNDYEEGTELETGIDNCWRVNPPTLASSTLSWTLSKTDNTYASLTTIDHFTVYYGAGGQLALAADNIANNATSLNLATTSVPTPYSQWQYYVQAVGAPMMQNQIAGTAGVGTGALTSLAAINFYDANGAPFTGQSGWTVSADSTDPTSSVLNAVDNLPGSFWITNVTGVPGQPHNLTINTTSPKGISGYSITPRQDGCDAGWPLNSLLNGGPDGVNWTSIWSGVFSYASDTLGCPGASQPRVKFQSLQPYAQSFPDTIQGMFSAPQNIVLTNTGNTTLNITSSSVINSNFLKTTGTCGSTLSAGSSCNLAAQFNPQSAGFQSGAYQVVDNSAAGSPQVVSLTGYGLASGTYLTNFSQPPAPENPIHEFGNWLTGPQIGVPSNFPGGFAMQTISGEAYGTQTGAAGCSAGTLTVCNDSAAALVGNWTANQHITATAINKSQNCNAEIELHLRSNISTSAKRSQLYEVDIRACTASTSAFINIARWNGDGTFDSICTNNGSQYGAANGDTFFAGITGDNGNNGPVTIKVVKNGTTTVTCQDTSSKAILTGNPGIGAFTNSGLASGPNWGWTNYVATSDGNGTQTGGTTNNYYVAVSGSDSNNGICPTTSTPGCTGGPWATINHAAANLVLGTAGTVVHIEPGTYNIPAVFTTFRSGTSTQRIAYQSDTDSAATLSCTNGQEACWFQEGDFVDIIGLAMTGPLTGGLVIGQDAGKGLSSTCNTVANPSLGCGFAAFNRVLGGTYHDIGSSLTASSANCDVSGVVELGSGNHDTLVDHITVRNGGVKGGCTTTTGASAHGIYVTGHNETITNNNVSNVAGAGIEVFHNVCNNVIANNTVFHNYTGGIQLAGINIQSGAPAFCSSDDFTSVTNNLLVDNGYGLGVGNCPSCGHGAYGMKVSAGTGTHNVCDNEGLINNWNTSGANTNNSLNIDAGANTCNPLNWASFTTSNLNTVFINYLASGLGNYHLFSPDASLINAGTTNGCAASPGLTPCVPTTDFSGTARPQGSAYDIGAYEQ